MQTDSAIFLKDLNIGSISITNSAELVCQIYAGYERIFYLDTESRWTEIIHNRGLFQRFAPVNDENILRIITARTAANIPDS
jgi:hypothetical protein